MFQQSKQHVDSYYAHSCADRLLERPVFSGEQDTEVVIIGAGFSGLHTVSAWRRRSRPLARPGTD